MENHIDFAFIALYLFWAFFFCLVWYLQREGRREGFPLVADPDGTALNQDMWMPSPKTFVTNDGRTRIAPDPQMADTRPLNAEFAVGSPGAPLVPTGDPMGDNLGPGSYTERPDITDQTFEGHPRIVPMRVASDFTVAEGDIDPRGTPVFGADGAQAGTVVDIWVDRSDYLIRYVEVELPLASGAEEGAVAQRVLVPFNCVQIRTDRDRFMEFIRMKYPKANAEIHVSAILASQFAGIPGVAHADQITMLEEEKVQAYFGSGMLYATPDRQEPFV